MRILHSSDWHLGRQFHNVSLLTDQAHILEQIVNLAIEHRVDVLIIAGDIYDRSVPPAAAVRLLNDFLQRLCRHHIAVIMIAGNHDSPDRLGFASAQLQRSGVYIAGLLSADCQPIVLRDSAGDVAFYTIPYAEPATVRSVLGVEVSSHDLATGELAARAIEHNRNSSESEGRRCVAISHCFLVGGEVCDSERPLSLGGADQVSCEHFQGFNYTALGHLHGPQHRGSQHIRYSGSPLKYSFSEQHQRKSVTLVELDSEGSCDYQQLPLKPLRDMRVIEGSLEQLLQAGASDACADDYLMVKLSDTHAILDVMTKLRTVYPNVLHLERSGLLAQSRQANLSRHRLQQGELSMFEDFYQQLTGDNISEPQRDILRDLLAQLHRGDD